jgi:hypothetical protein
MHIAVDSWLTKIDENSITSPSTWGIISSNSQGRYPSRTLFLGWHQTHQNESNLHRSYSLRLHKQSRTSSRSPLHLPRQPSVTRRPDVGREAQLERQLFFEPICSRGKPSLPQSLSRVSDLRVGDFVDLARFLCNLCLSRTSPTWIMPPISAKTRIWRVSGGLWRSLLRAQAWAGQVCRLWGDEHMAPLLHVLGAKCESFFPHLHRGMMLLLDIVKFRCSRCCLLI